MLNSLADVFKVFLKMEIRSLKLQMNDTAITLSEAKQLLISRDTLKKVGHFNSNPSFIQFVFIDTS